MFRRIVEIEGAPSLNYLGMKMSPDRAEVMERAGWCFILYCLHSLASADISECF